MARTKSTYLALVAILLSPMAANAGLVIIDVVPSPDAQYPFTMTGSFEFDAATETYSNLIINLTASIGPYNFVDAACEGCPKSGSSSGLVDPTLSLTYFLSDLVVTWEGGAVTAIFTGNSFSLSEANGRLDGTYSLRAETVAVPEPGSIALFGLGLAGLGFMRRRRKV